jgi:D-alanine--D-alanine ligase
VHGSNAEDGAIQGFFELYHVPYSGSGIQSSAMAMDKNLTKMLLESVGIPVPKGKIVHSVNEDLTLPGVTRYVVKPNAQGSTVGLSFVESGEGLRPAVEKALLYSETALIEEWVVGTEISVPVLGSRVLDPVEVIPRSGRYDFANKYTPGATEEICPARLTPAQTEIAKRQALLAHQTMRCTGATRTDMIVTEDRIVALEVNTLPGMTPTSLLPLAAKTAGMSFADLCEWLMEDALHRNGQ